MAHKWAGWLPHRCRMGDPRGYVAIRPTCGPLLILSPALKRWGTHKWQGLCSHLAHLWAIAEFVPRFEALRTPHGVAVMSPPGPLLG